MNLLLDVMLTSTLLALVVKASVLLAIAACADALLRRRASASARHLLWGVTLVALLALPVLSMALPSWRVAVRRAEPPSIAPAFASERAGAFDEPLAAARAGERALVEQRDDRADAANTTPAWFQGLLTWYVAGLLAMLAHVVVQHHRLRRLLRDARAIDDAVWTRELSECATGLGVRGDVRLLRSSTCGMPMAVGVRRHAIVIPAVADTWPEDRRRAVLLHEMAHVARRDCLWHAVALAARALYWFHPAAWWAVSRLRVERELACDDRVLAAGAPARDYASHLLEIAYAFGKDRAPALAVTMARPRQLEGRMLAVLDARRNRRTPAKRWRVLTTAAAATLIVPLAMMTVTVASPDAFEPAREAATQAGPSGTPRTPQETGPELKSTAEVMRSAVRGILRDTAAAFGLRAAQEPGTWEIRPSKSGDGTVHLRLTERDSSFGTDVRLAQLEGLTGAQLTGAGGPVQFKLRRDAGTFTFEGVIRNGVGAGTYSFAADPSFAQGLSTRGFARPSAEEQYKLARHDIGYAYVDELVKQGYTKPTTGDLVRAGEHGVHTTYLREMGELGYRLGTLAPLIELRDHGVSPGYIRALAAQGFKGLPADELRRARDHGISPEYVTAMREAGHGSLPMDALIRARDHGVSADYVREMRALGYRLALDDLVRARDHGVSVDYIRGMAEQGYRNVPIDSLVRLRDHGVSAEFAKEIRSLGYDKLSIDDLVTLRDHGLTPDRIRAANARAGTRLPVERLISR